MHHKYIQVLQPQHANTQYSCRDKRRRDKQQYSSARSIPSRRRGKQKAMAGRSSRRAAPPCRHPGSAGSTAGTPSLASPFQVRTRERILVAPARRLQFLDSPLYAAARSGRGGKKKNGTNPAARDKKRRSGAQFAAANQRGFSFPCVARSWETIAD